MSKKILVVSQYFYPESFRINDICKEWVNRGYEVTVLTGIPNYPEGKFYTGYGYNKKRKEIWNGVEIIRIPLIPRGKSSVGLISNYLSFVVSGAIWTLFTKITADYVFTFEVSPMTQALIGVWYAKKFRVPHYLYVQDLWPENVEIVTGIKSPFIIQPIRKMVNYIYKNSTEIFATSPSFVEEIQKWVTNKEKVHYWPQYAEEFYRPIEKEKQFNDDCLRIMFTGNIGYAQGLEILPKTAVELKKSGCKVLFQIVGDGRYKEEFCSEIAKCGVSNMFKFYGRRPAEEIPELLANSDFAFISFMESSLFEKTIPAKLQSYMACGMPIIAAAGGETKRIVEENNCGSVSPIGNERALVENIQKCMKLSQETVREMGNNAKKYCDAHFLKKDLMDEMDKYFEKIEVVLKRV